MKREDKLALLSDTGSIAGISDWRDIVVDRHHDWIHQRDEAFGNLYPMGSKAAKAGQPGRTIFRLFSNGYKTKRDAYLYNLSLDTCAMTARKSINDYQGALHARQLHPEYTLPALLSQWSRNIRWDPELADKMWRGRQVFYSKDRIRRAAYRPFIGQYLYAEPTLAQRPGIMGTMFPAFISPTGMVSHDAANRVICVAGIGSTTPFSALIVDAMPDLHFLGFGQCFPRYRFAIRADEHPDLLEDPANSVPVDNITDTALAAFREHYRDPEIIKDAIFDYVYGVLHAPAYRERFRNDLAKDMPRISLAPDFDAFGAAGCQLAALHLGYETCQEHPLDVVSTRPGELAPRYFRLGDRAMRFAEGDKSVLIVNEHVRLAGIPPEAHAYVVNGRTPLEWFIDRYRVTRDSHSGIVNDPNAWFSSPEDLIPTIRRIVHVSVETARIVAGLPDPFVDLARDSGTGQTS